jgi:hypothetical protein
MARLPVIFGLFINPPQIEFRAIRSVTTATDRADPRA